MSAIEPVDGQVLVVHNSTISGRATGVRIVGSGNTIHLCRATVEGDCNTVSGRFNTVMGRFNTVFGDHATVHGNENTIHGRCHYVDGAINTVNSVQSYVNGDGNTIVGVFCAVIGTLCIIKGDNCQIKGHGSVDVGGRNTRHIGDDDAFIPVGDRSLPPPFVTAPKITPSNDWPSMDIDRPVEKEPARCSVCYENMPSIRLTPCGHTRLCAACFIKLRNRVCPDCRAPITRWDRAIL